MKNIYFFRLRAEADETEEYLLAPQILAPAINFSNHWFFWKFGYQAVMLTDTAFYRTPYYHAGQDFFEKLDYASMAELVKAFYQVLLELRRMNK